MKKIVSMVIILLFITSGFGAIAYNNNVKEYKKVINNEKAVGKV